MKITITGASGFIGQNLSKYFEDRGIPVAKVSLRHPDFSISPQTDAIIHLAGKAHDTANTSAEASYFEVNTELTKQVFQKFLDSQARDFLYFSSVKAVADTVRGTLDEAHLPDPTTPYGMSKLQAEKYLLSQKLPGNRRLFIIRPCMVHGPGNKGNLNLLYKLVEKGLPWPLANFENQRSFLSIDNLSFLVLGLLRDTTALSGVYNFADDVPLSTNALIAIIANTMGREEKLWRVPPGVIRSFAKVGDALGLPLNSERLKKLVESYVVSNQKIKSALHIDRLPLSSEEGLVKTIKSFNQQSSKK